MDGLVKEYLVSFYSRSLSLHGDRPEALRWSPEGQRKRYEVLLDIGDLSGKKLLDYGCGKGDFYGFLRGKGIDADYTGADINPDLIGLAGRKYPDCKFMVLDIEEGAGSPCDIGAGSPNLFRRGPCPPFDYIFLCGVFNQRLDGVNDTIKNVLSRLWPHARLGLAFNALSNRAPRKDPELKYTSPEELSTFAREELAAHIVLRHDYLPEDFTLFLYRNGATKPTGS